MKDKIKVGRTVLDDMNLLYRVKAYLKDPNKKTADAAYVAARDAARGAAWDAARDAARGAADILATFTPTYKLNTPFVKLLEIWELGMYPCGIIDGKFVVYTPIDFDTPEAPKVEAAPHEVIIDGVRYVPAKD